MPLFTMKNNSNKILVFLPLCFHLRIFPFSFPVKCNIRAKSSVSTVDVDFPFIAAYYWVGSKLFNTYAASCVPTEHNVRIAPLLKS